MYTKSKKAVNVYDIVKETFIAKIETEMSKNRTERIKWVKPWSIASLNVCNYVTVRPYHGANVWLLDGYGSEFLTFKQIQDLQTRDEKIQLRKGSKGHLVTYFKWLESSETDTDTGDEVTAKIPMLKYFRVFSANDVEGLELRNPPETFEHTTIEEREKAMAEMLFAYLERENITITETDCGRAFYCVNTDSIDIPKDKYFQRYSTFLDTLAHEVGHSTGYATRLNRKLANKKSSEKYSYEELIAEFTATLLMAQYGLTSETSEEQSIAYLTSWVSHITNCPAKILVSAFSQAEKTANFIVGNTPKTESEET